MNRLTCLVTVLLCTSVISCKKENITKEEKEEAPVLQPPPGNSPYKLDGLSLIPLTNNGDGTWSGVFAGMQCRFGDFMYEIIYDGFGNPLPPKTGDPCWPYSIGPEPGVTPPGNFNCLRFITNINSPDNQISAQNTCQFYGSIYSPGAGLYSYWNAVESSWNAYQNALNAYYTNVSSSPYYAYPRPNPPQTPLITPYLTQDFVYGSATPLIFTARFGIIYDAGSGQVSFGIDAR
ncbi:MAG: hypothetical protein QM731_08670 [Chitinophagaceae bacterium]